MPIKYIPFIPEPVEGQAVLGNFNRILRYKGADELSMTLQRGMPLYEMEKQETVGENTGGNMVIRGECVSACAYLKEQGIQVDLVYIDPPFASGADYAKKVYIRRNPKVAEVIAQAERELDVDELKAFEEKMYGDVWDKEKYLYFGRIPAKLDDAANYLPSRLAGLLWCAAAALTGNSAKGAWRIWRRDRRNHASPNSAQTESACAGALGVQLAGPAYYFGEYYPKPTIGDALRPIEPEDIRRANKMMYAESLLALLLGLAIRGVIL